MKKALALLILFTLLTSAALAMEKERAIELVRLADDKALGARQFWVELSGDADGAWVFCATDGKIPYFKGAFWYVEESRAVPLGAASNVYSWQLLRTEPEIYVAALGKPDGRRVSACFLGKGVPTMIENAHQLTNLVANGASLYTILNKNADKAFLRLDGARLVEVSAVPISRADFESFPGASELLEELAAGGYLPTEYLYRSTGVVSINVATDQDAKIRHLDVFIDRGAEEAADDADGDETFLLTDLLGDAPQVLNPERGWENEAVLWDGAAKPKYKVGLDIVPSDPFVPYGG